MGTFNIAGPFAYDDDREADKLLAQYDTYIIALARKKIPRNIIPIESLSDEIDELAQKIRIKFWQIAQRQHIIYPKTYIDRIAYTESVDMVRRHKTNLSLPMNEDIENSPINLLLGSKEETQDPAEKFEQEEAVIELTGRAVEKMLALPPRQQYAMISSLKEKIADILPLVESLKDYGVEIEEMSWPHEQEESQRLRASLSVARNKLLNLKNESGEA